MTLGMIWTIILRFAIQDISVEGEFLLCSIPSQGFTSALGTWHCPWENLRPRPVVLTHF